MATNYTQNYSLCQWEPDDAVVREDFNADNQKLDDALSLKASVAALEALTAQVTQLQSTLSANVSALRGENCWVKLGTRSIGVGTSYSFAVSGLSAYKELHVKFNLPISGGDSISSFLMTLNQITTADYYSTDHYINGSGQVAYPLTSFTHGAALAGDFTLSAYGAAATAIRGQCINTSAMRQGYGNTGGACLAVPYTGVTSIQLSLAKGNFLSGGLLTLYGVK